MKILPIWPKSSFSVLFPSRKFDTKFMDIIFIEIFQSGPSSVKSIHTSTALIINKVYFKASTNYICMDSQYGLNLKKKNIFKYPKSPYLTILIDCKFPAMGRHDGVRFVVLENILKC